MAQEWLLIFELIYTYFQDPDSKFALEHRAKYSYFVRKSRIGLFVVVVAFVTFFPSLTAYAGVFSYWESLWTKIVPNEENREPQNSQTIAFFEAATNLDPNPAKGGGDITIVDDSAFLPDVGPSGTIVDIELNERQGRVSLYVARRGDTFPQIAKMFGVSVNTIFWANDLSRRSILREGQTLVILPISGVQYVVKKNDTLESIAKKYKGTIAEIRNFNNVESTEDLVMGETIIIPDGEEIFVPVAKSGALSGGTKSRYAAYPSHKGYYTHPLPTMRLRTQGIHGYNGVDLAAPKGETVVAAADGTVIVSRFNTTGNPWFGGYGNYIVVEHANGTQTLYAHLNAVYVSIGARVTSGQPIGEVGSTGRSTGAHLHFEVRGAKNPF